MKISKGKLKIVLPDIIFVAVMIFFQFNPLFSIRIGGANPMLPLAAIIVISVFSSELYAVFAGLIAGMFCDSVSNTDFGFNAVTFILIGFAVSFIMHYLFNNNVRSAVALSILASLFYFALKWLFFNAIGHSAADSFIYLYRAAIPSAIYTAASAIPFYFLKKHIMKKAHLL